MTEAPKPLPAAFAGNDRPWLRTVLIASSLAVGCGAIALARAYARPEPSPEAPPPGMRVNGQTLLLDANAPQWAIIKTDAAKPPEPTWSEPIPARVMFDEARTARLGTPLPGRITAVYVAGGQQVKAGAPLFAVSSANLADLVANRQKATVERDTARASLRRTQDAVDAQVLPAKELVAARQVLANAELAVELAEQRMQALQVNRAGGAAFTVTAPRDGVVVERAVALGQTVSPDNGSLVAIADLSTVWIVTDVFASHAAAIAVGTKAKVLVGSGGDAERDATVDQVSSVIDPDRHAVPVRIRLDNEDGELRPNAHVQVRVFDPTPSVATVPATAVMSDGDHSFVYVDHPHGTLSRRDVEVGPVVAGNVPVLRGLSPSDRVVVSGAILIDNEIALEQ